MRHDRVTGAAATGAVNGLSVRPLPGSAHAYPLAVQFAQNNPRAQRRREARRIRKMNEAGGATSYPGGSWHQPERA